MFLDELDGSLGDRWIRRRRGYMKGIGDESTPIRKWKLLSGDSVGGVIRGRVSARKLAASMWRLCAAAIDYGGSVRRRCGYALFGGLHFELRSWLPPNTKLEMEGIAKWDLCYSKTLVNVSRLKDGEIATIASARQPALCKTQKHINGLGAEGGLREKHSSCVKKLDEERPSRIRKYHNQGMHSTVKNLAVDIKREREKCKKLDILNSKMLSDITKTKSSTRKFMQSLEREKKARKLLEHVCDELATAVKGNKTEIVELRNQHARVQRNAEEERNMMQIGEVWLEEQAQRMLVDAKFLLEDKHNKMNGLIADAEAFLRPTSTSKNVMNKAKDLNHAFDPQVNGSPGKSKLSSGLAACEISGYRDTIDKQTLTQNEICAPKFAAGCKRNTRSDISSISPKQSKKKDLSINDPRSILPRDNVHTHNTISSTASFSCPRTALHEGAVDNRASVHQQRNPHVDRAIKGHIMWPRGVQRHGLAAKHLHARLESQRMLIRNVLKQRC